MKRETRINLIFLTVFLAAALPGMVILFKRKLDPAAPPLFMPDFVRRRLPYMASQLSPDSEVTRYVPELTGHWVQAINDSHGAGQVLLDGHHALISDDRQIQITAADVTGQQTTLALLAWNADYKSDPRQYTVTASANGQILTANVTHADRIPMPLNVKKELMYAGVIQPPATVTWLATHFDRPLDGSIPWTIQVTYQNTKSTVVRPPMASSLLDNSFRKWAQTR